MTTIANSVAEPPNTELNHETLTDIIDLALWAGQLLLQYGADSRRIEETTHRIGTSLGCNWLDVFVSYNTIIITTSSGSEFRTKVRRVPRIGVDMTIISAVNRLSRRVASEQLDRET